MDFLSLPVCDPNTTVQDALDLMMRRKRRAVVMREDDGALWLVGRGQLDEAPPTNTLQGISPSEREPLARPSLAEIATHGEGILFAQAAKTVTPSAPYQQLLGQRPYMALAASKGSVIVVTTSEDIRAALRGTGFFQCAGPAPHKLPTPAPTANNMCPIHYAPLTYCP